MSSIKPIFLLADSQLLFWREDGKPFLARVRALLDEDAELTGGGANGGGATKAAYLGASNGDAPEFYELFVAAMEQIGVVDCRHIPAKPGDEDMAFLAQAALILLGGGEVERGWEAFKAAGLDQKLIERYYGGALLIGVSAGAVQLGLKGWDEAGTRSIDMLRIVPFVVDAHDEPGWTLLLRAVPKAGEHSRGLGVPSGGGALYHPDYSIEPLRHPVVEVSQTETGLKQALLFPGELSAPAEVDADSAARAAAPETTKDGPGAAPADSTGAAHAAHVADTTGNADTERQELGYRITPDGTIEILPQGGPDRSGADDEPVN
jgi:hypothetical protein